MTTKATEDEGGDGGTLPRVDKRKESSKANITKAIAAKKAKQALKIKEVKTKEEAPISSSEGESESETESDEDEVAAIDNALNALRISIAEDLQKEMRANYKQMIKPKMKKMLAKKVGGNQSVTTTSKKADKEVVEATVPIKQSVPTTPVVDVLTSWRKKWIKWGYAPFTSPTTNS